MEQQIERCAGLDVHQGTVVACVRIAASGRKTQSETRTFETLPAGLRALRAWLQEQGATHAVMEGTGVYWIPVYTALEGAVDLTLANAHHVRNVPGRKTDVGDAAWLAQLLAHGLLRKSFVPPAEVRRIRDLTRFRVNLVRARATAANQLIKTLETYGLKIASVVSDVLGATGRALVRALADGVTDAAALGDCARGKLRAKRPQLAAAVATPLASHQRLLLDFALRRIESADREVAALDEVIAAALVPHAALLDLVKTVTGLEVVSASALLGEIGVDMRAFVDAHHLASWAGLCPGQRESAGKSKRGKTRRGNPYVKRVMTQAAWAATRVKGSYAQAKYHRLKARSSAGTALVAVAHKLLTAIYHMLLTGQPYRDLGAEHLDRKDAARSARRLVQRLEHLGYAVDLKPNNSEGGPAMSTS
jgi:transposase